jgi:hypothetical protein
MALEDRIRPTVEAALAGLTTRVENELHSLVQQVLELVRQERAEAIETARLAAREEAAAQLRQAMEAAEARLTRALADADATAAAAVREAVASARGSEREIEMADAARLLDGIRALDAAASLSEVLDTLGEAAAREASRAAVLVVRDGRVSGWKLSGFAAWDTQPKSIDLGLEDSGVIATAIETADPVATGHGTHAAAPAFAQLPADRIGWAVPVLVGGRAVAVVYADGGNDDGLDRAVPSAWPERIEILTRHAGRCLEALTMQKAAASSGLLIRAAATTVPSVRAAASQAERVNVSV